MALGVSGPLGMDHMSANEEPVALQVTFLWFCRSSQCDNIWSCL